MAFQVFSKSNLFNFSGSRRLYQLVWSDKNFSGKNEARLALIRFYFTLFICPIFEIPESFLG